MQLLFVYPSPFLIHDIGNIISSEACSMIPNTLDLNKNNLCVFMYYVRICITFGVIHILYPFLKRLLKQTSLMHKSSSWDTIRKSLRIPLEGWVSSDLKF